MLLGGVVAFRDPMVLPEMLGPRFHEEGLNETARITRVFGDQPSIGAVSSTQAAQFVGRLDECVGIGWIDPVRGRPRPGHRPDP